MMELVKRTKREEKKRHWEKKEKTGTTQTHDSGRRNRKESQKLRSKKR